MEPAGPESPQAAVHDVSLQLASPGRGPGPDIEEASAVCEPLVVRSEVAIPSSPGRIVVTSVQVSDGFTTVPQNGQSDPCNPLSIPCLGYSPVGEDGDRNFGGSCTIAVYWGPSSTVQHGVLRSRFKITCPLQGWCEQRGVGTLISDYEFGIPLQGATQ
jgi:hypothetical protein